MSPAARWVSAAMAVSLAIAPVTGQVTAPAPQVRVTRLQGAVVWTLPVGRNDQGWWSQAAEWGAGMALPEGVRAIVADFLGKAAGSIGGLMVSFLAEARVVGNPSRFAVVVAGSRGVGARLDAAPGEELLPLLTYDSGNEMRWAGGLALSVEVFEPDPLLPRPLGALPAEPPAAGIWRFAARLPLVLQGEGADVFNNPAVSTGLYWIAPVEPLRFAESGFYRLKLEGSGAEAVVRVLGGAPGIQGCGPVDLALLVDSSGSMRDNDPGNLRHEAGALLIDRTPPGTTFTVVDFDSTATAVVARSQDREAARRAVRQADASGGTDVAAALAAGYQQLTFGGGNRAAVLFTDGRSDRRDGAERFAAAGIPVHVVGLGRDVDVDFLRRLAASTGGIYMQAARASDLVGAFDHVVAELACEGTVITRRGVIRQGELAEVRFLVDPFIQKLTVRLTWPGSRLGLELLDPGGTPAGSITASGPTYRIVSVDGPAAGQWTARITGEEIPGAETQFALAAGGASELRLAMSPGNAQDPSALRLQLLGGARGTVARAWSRVTTPSGSVVDGPAPRAAGSGVWEVAVPVEAAGVYAVTAGLGGDSGGARWEREVTRTVVMGAGEIPWRGRITRVEGGYVEINRGQRHGVRVGMTVEFLAGGARGGVGLVTAVEAASSTVEVAELFGATLLQPGMTAEVDRAQWMGDRRP